MRGISFFCCAHFLVVSDHAIKVRPFSNRPGLASLFPKNGVEQLERTCFMGENWMSPCYKQRKMMGESCKVAALLLLPVCFALGYHLLGDLLIIGRSIYMCMCTPSGVPPYEPCRGVCWNHQTTCFSRRMDSCLFWTSFLVLIRWYDGRFDQFVLDETSNGVLDLELFQLGRQQPVKGCILIETRDRPTSSDWRVWGSLRRENRSLRYTSAVEIRPS